MKKRFLAFGMLLGGALGILGSSLEILVWISKGRPAIPIRRGWEDAHIVSMAVFGLVAGCLYGTILSWIIKPESLRLNAAFVFLLTLLAGIALYTPAAFITMRLQEIWPSLYANVVIFLTSLIIARLLSKRSRS